MPKSPRLIDPRNRVALPKEVRAFLGVEAGDYVTFRVEEGQVHVYRLELRVVPSPPPRP